MQTHDEVVKNLLTLRFLTGVDDSTVSSPAPSSAGVSLCVCDCVCLSVSQSVSQYVSLSAYRSLCVCVRVCCAHTHTKHMHLQMPCALRTCSHAFSLIHAFVYAWHHRSVQLNFNSCVFWSGRGPWRGGGGGWRSRLAMILVLQYRCMCVHLSVYLYKLISIKYSCT